MPVQKLTFLGSVLDFELGMIYIPDYRILKLKSALESCLQRSVISARELASITGQIISMSCAVGNLTRLSTRSCYLSIEQRTSWDDLLCISSELRRELSFWINSIDAVNGRRMIPKSSSVAQVSFIPTLVTLVLAVAWSRVVRNLFLVLGQIRKCIPVPRLGRFWQSNLFCYPCLIVCQVLQSSGSRITKTCPG